MKFTALYNIFYILYIIISIHVSSNSNIAVFLFKMQFRTRKKIPTYLFSDWTKTYRFFVIFSNIVLIILVFLFAEC